MVGGVVWMAYGPRGEAVVNELSIQACHSIMEPVQSDIRGLTILI